MDSSTPTINVSFSDDEFKQLKSKKGNSSWHDYILDLAGVKHDGRRKGSSRLETGS